MYVHTKGYTQTQFGWHTTPCVASPSPPFGWHTNPVWVAHKPHPLHTSIDIHNQRLPLEQHRACIALQLVKRLPHMGHHRAQHLHANLVGGARIVRLVSSLGVHKEM